MEKIRKKSGKIGKKSGKIRENRGKKPGLLGDHGSKKSASAYGPLAAKQLVPLNGRA